MSRTSLPAPLRGIIPPLATPLVDDDRLDVPGLERLVEHVLAGGVHGLFVLGTTGEGPSLSYRLRHEVVQHVCRLVEGRVPVLVGVTDSSPSESLRLAQFAAEAGAQGVVLAAPFYFSVEPAELTNYLKRMARELPLPTFLYNMPSHTKLAFEPDTVKRVLDLPTFVGLKDSSGQMTYFHCIRQLVTSREDFSVLIGPEELLAESIMLGGQGGVCGGANLLPRLYVDLYEAAVRGDLETTQQLHQHVIQLSSTIYSIGSPHSSFIKGLKTALETLGICSGRLALPFQGFSPAERGQFNDHLQTLEPLLSHYLPGLNDRAQSGQASTQEISSSQS